MSLLGVAVVLMCLLGIPAGIGAFTFVYAKSYSYLSTDPRTCLNCHIMNPQYEGWLKSGHRHTTVCVDCRLRARLRRPPRARLMIEFAASLMGSLPWWGACSWRRSG